MSKFELFGPSGGWLARGKGQIWFAWSPFLVLFWRGKKEQGEEKTTDKKRPLAFEPLSEPEEFFFGQGKQL